MDLPLATQSLSPLARSPVAEEVECLITQRTGGQIRGLHVEVEGSTLLLTGQAGTYYVKQLATHAALEVTDHMLINNEIEVY